VKSDRLLSISASHRQAAELTSRRVLVALWARRQGRHAVPGRRPPWPRPPVSLGPDRRGTLLDTPVQGRRVQPAKAAFAAAPAVGQRRPPPRHPHQYIRRG